VSADGWAAAIPFALMDTSPASCPFLSPRVSIEGPLGPLHQIYGLKYLFSLKTHDADKTLFLLEIEGKRRCRLAICHTTIVIVIVIVIIDTGDQGKFPPS
jgi:hypothetical protein